MVDGQGSPVDFTRPAAEGWWREQAKRVLELGVEGIKADDGEGWYFPDDVRFADGTTRRAGGVGARAASTGARCSARSTRCIPETGVLFGRPGWTGQQAVGITWGGDQPRDFWSLRTLVAATLTAAAPGFSNWSHDVGGYLGEQLMARCPKELLARWVQFGCFTPLMHAHGRFEQEAWTYDDELLRIYRAHVLLHERLVPYVRAAAARRTHRPADHPPARADRSRRRPRLVDRRRLRLRPVAVGRAGARGRRAQRPRRPPARRLDRLLDGRAVAGGGEIDAPRAARPDPRVGPARRADRHLSGRARRPRAGRHAGAPSAPRGHALGRAALRPRRRPARRRHRSCAATAANSRSSPTPDRLNFKPNLAQRSVHNLRRAGRRSWGPWPSPPLAPLRAPRAGLGPACALDLEDGARTTIHVAVHDARATELRVAVLRGQAKLEPWCAANGVEEAIVGGFFARPHGTPLGEVRTRGVAREHVPFTAPFDARARVRARRRRRRAIAAARRAPGRSRAAICSRRARCSSATAARSSAARRTARASAPPTASSTPTSPTAATRAPRSASRRTACSRSPSTAAHATTPA